MSDVFLGQLILVPYNFAPTGFAVCSGQLLSIAQNTALFSLLGTTYGGDGRSNFALPNLQGQVPVGAGQGPGLSQYSLGQSAGSPSETMSLSEMPLHDHLVQGASFPAANQSSASGNSFGQQGTISNYVPGSPALDAPMNPAAVGVAGSSAAHNNMMPFLTMIWMIALQGIFPARS